MRAVLLALLLLPSPVAALVIEYELAARTQEACFLPATSDEPLCGVFTRPLSSLRDRDGHPFAFLEGHLTLELKGPTTRVTAFSVEGNRGGTPGVLSLRLVPWFTLDLLGAADASNGRLNVATAPHNGESKRTLEFDPAELLADLDRLEFVAGLVPGITIEAVCLVSRRGVSFSQMPVAIATVQEVESRAGAACDEARDDPLYSVLELPERELVELHIVAVPVPEPAAVLLLGVGAALLGARRNLGLLP